MTTDGAGSAFHRAQIRAVEGIDRCGDGNNNEARVGKSRRISGVIDVDGGQFRAADFAGGIDATAQLIDLLRTDVEADDRGFLRKGNCQREADITETDQGNLGLTCGDLFYCDHFFLQNHH